jgi:hypothetical protein
MVTVSLTAPVQEQEELTGALPVQWQTSPPVGLRVSGMLAGAQAQPVRVAVRLSGMATPQQEAPLLDDEDDRLLLLELLRVDELLLLRVEDELLLELLANIKAVLLLELLRLLELLVREAAELLEDADLDDDVLADELLELLPDDSDDEDFEELLVLLLELDCVLLLEFTLLDELLATAASSQQT